MERCGSTAISAHDDRPVAYFIDTNRLNQPGKTPYTPFLPTPEARGAPPAPATRTQLQNNPASSAPFRRIPEHEFQITGRHVPYDSYTGDMVHRFFHMWQQSDCDAGEATASDAAGCRNDLYPFVGIGRGDESSSNSMGFYDVQRGDAPLFKRLADEYTMSDNYHQPVMGGTAVQHTMVMTGDALPWDHVGSFPAEPPAAQIADPTPKSATNVGFVRDDRGRRRTARGAHQ